MKRGDVTKHFDAARIDRLETENTCTTTAKITLTEQVQVLGLQV